jgi:hypothetical protein
MLATLTFLKMRFQRRFPALLRPGYLLLAALLFSAGKLPAVADLQNLVVTGTLLPGQMITVKFDVLSTTSQTIHAAFGLSTSNSLANGDDPKMINWLADSYGIFGAGTYWVNDVSATATNLTACDLQGPQGAGLTFGSSNVLHPMTVIARIPMELAGGTYYLHLIAKENFNLYANAANGLSIEDKLQATLVIGGTPTYKLDLKVCEAVSDSDATVQSMTRLRWRIYNYGEAGVALPSLAWRFYFNDDGKTGWNGSNGIQTEVFYPNFTPYYGLPNNSVASFGSIGAADCGSSRTANRYFEWAPSIALQSGNPSYFIPPAGGYAQSNNLIWFRHNDFGGVDRSNDYARPGDIGLCGVPTNDYFRASLYNNGALVCEYVNATTLDPATGQEPCSVSGCSTPTPTPTITPSVTQTWTGTATETPSNTPSVTQTWTGTFTVTPSNTPSVTQTWTDTFTGTPSNTPSVTQTWTDTFTGTPSNTPSVTQTWTGTFTVTPSNTPSVTQTWTGTFTETPSGTPSVTRTWTYTGTVTPSVTPSITPTFSRTASPTPSSSATPSITVTSTVTLTPCGTVRPVCSSCAYTTLLAAYTAAGPCDWIELQGDIADESLAVIKNIAGIRGDSAANKRTWNATGNPDNLTVSNGVTQLFQVQDLKMTHSSGGGSGVQMFTWSATAIVRFINIDFSHLGPTGDCMTIAAPGSVQALLIDRCSFTGGVADSDSGVVLNGTGLDRFTIRNSLFRRFGNKAISLASSSTSVFGNIFNCTMDGSGIGLSMAQRAVVTNCLFTNNTTDANIAGNALNTDFTYCAFEQATSFGGTGNLFGIVSTNEYANEATQNYSLKSGAQCRNAGTAVTGVVEDLSGTARPQEGANDIGAYEYFIPGTPTITQTFSATPSITQTRTVTVTFSHSPTSTETPSITVTSTFTPSVTQTSTFTPSVTPTSTFTPSITRTFTATPSVTETSTETPSITQTRTITPSVTQSSTVTPSITRTSTATPSITMTSTETPSITQTRTITPSVTQTSTVTPSITQTSTVTPSITRTSTATPSITVTSTETPSITETRTITPSVTQTSTITPSATQTSTVTPSITRTSTATPSITVTSTESPSVSQTSTMTPSVTETSTATPSITRSSTATPSVTPSVTDTFSSTETRTGTATPSVTPSVTDSFTSTETRTGTATPSVTPSVTDSFTSTETRTSTATPSVTPSVTDSFTSTETRTSTATPSVTPSVTDSFTRTETRTSTMTPTLTPSATQSFTFSATATRSATRSFTESYTPTATLTATPTFTASPSVTETSTPCAACSPTPTPAPLSFAVTLRLYDSSGLLQRTLALPSSASALAAVRPSSDPYDPSGGPLTLSEGSWSAAFDGLDAHGLALPNGAYVLEIESAGGGATTKQLLNLQVLGKDSDPVRLLAAPNPVLPGTRRVQLRWDPPVPVELKAYNLNGELVVDFGVCAGPAVDWNLDGGGGTASGVYWVSARKPADRLPRLFKLMVAR